MIGHARTASPSLDDRDARREMDDAKRETVYRLLWLASLWIFPNEEQYARIFPDKPWRFSGANRAAGRRSGARDGGTGPAPVAEAVGARRSCADR